MNLSCTHCGTLSIMNCAKFQRDSVQNQDDSRTCVNTRFLLAGASCRIRALRAVRACWLASCLQDSVQMEGQTYRTCWNITATPLPECYQLTCRTQPTTRLPRKKRRCSSRANRNNFIFIILGDGNFFWVWNVVRTPSCSFPDVHL